jgi:hypothetical protein
MSPHQNAKAVADNKAKVQAHCMCARFIEDETHYLVLYPAGYYPDAVRASKGQGQAVALERMLGRMERDWKGSFA